MLVKATTPFHRMNINTSTPPKTLTGEEKIAKPGSMTSTDPLVTATKGRSRAGTTKGTIQSPANLKGEHNLRNNASKASSKSSAT